MTSKIKSKHCLLWLAFILKCVLKKLSIRKMTRGRYFRISGWGCASETLEPLAYTRASSAEFCCSVLE